MKVNQITETTAGATSAGSVASVAAPLGKVQKRTGNLFKGKKTNKKFYESKMKDLAYDIQHLDAGNFMKKYGQPKDYFTKKLGKPPVSEAELSEQDLIVVPGMRKSKDTSFIPHEKDRRDHEVEMARSDLYAAAKDAMRIHKILKGRSEDQGLMGWQQSYITLASDYLNSVADSLEHQAANEMTAGVLAGGMSNFEESKDKPSPDAEKLEKLKKLLYRNRSNTKEFGKKASLTTKELDLVKKEIKRLTTKANVSGTNEMKGRYYNPLDQERREQDAMDQERRDFKRREMEYELRGEEEAARRANEGPWYIRIDGKLVKDKNKDPYVFNTLEAASKAAQTMMKKDWNKGKQFSYSRTPTDAEKKLDEKKDACYSKVKSRYKVWPSAYASGALVKCRKVGASNWGNKSKK